MPIARGWLCQCQSLIRTRGTFVDGCIDSALDGIQAEKATATQEADLHAIRGLVESKPGGFAQLNTVVRRHLQKWFESQGAVKSGARVIKGQRPSAILAPPTRHYGTASRKIHPVPTANEYDEYANRPSPEYVVEGTGSAQPLYAFNQSTDTDHGAVQPFPMDRGAAVGTGASSHPPPQNTAEHAKDPFYFHSSAL